MQSSRAHKRKAEKQLGNANPKRARSASIEESSAVDDAMKDPSAPFQDQLNFKLITSALDRTDLVSVKRVDIIGQYGIFAKQDITAGTEIGEYTGKVVDVSIPDDDRDTSYFMDLTRKKVIDSRSCGNFTRLVNHSENALNTRFHCRQHSNKKIVVLKAETDIPKGTQLLANYGTLYEFQHNTMIYLNGDDCDVSAMDFYNKHRNSYTLLTLEEDYPRFNLKVDDCLAFPKIIQDKRHYSQANYPIFEIKDGSISAYQDFDCISPLAWVCYFGDAAKVSYLSKLHADINRQQHKSGLTPLHFAVFGYNETEGSTAYLDIIKTLIETGAKLNITDKEDKTPLHYAVHYLKSQDLDAILKNISLETFKELLALIDKNHDDLILSTMREKKFDNLNILLDKFPGYLVEYFKPDKLPRGRGAKKKIADYYYDATDLLDVIENYSQAEAEQLLDILAKYKAPQNLSTVVQGHFNKSAPKEVIEVELNEGASQEANVTEEANNVDSTSTSTPALYLQSTVQHGFFGPTLVNVVAMLNKFDESLLELLDKHKCFQHDFYRLSQEATANAELLSKTKSDYLNNQLDASNLLRKLCKYHVTLNKGNILLDHVNDRMSQLKNSFSQITSTPINEIAMQHNVIPR